MYCHAYARFPCFVSFRSPSLFCLLTLGVEVVYFHLITLRHTPQSVGLLSTGDRPLAETPTWQHKHCTRDKHPCPLVGFEPTIPASARPQTYALDRAAAGIGHFPCCSRQWKKWKRVFHWHWAGDSLYGRPSRCCKQLRTFLSQFNRYKSIN
jgi:hypothetical protein